MSLSKNINPSLVLVQPRKTSPFITERLLMGRKESNQTNKKLLFCMFQSQTETVIEDGEVLDLSINNELSNKDMYIEEQALDLTVKKTMSRRDSESLVDLSKYGAINAKTFKLGVKESGKGKRGRPKKAPTQTVTRKKRKTTQRKDTDEEKVDDDDDDEDDCSSSGSHGDMSRQHSREDFLHAEMLLSLKACVGSQGDEGSREGSPEPGKKSTKKRVQKRKRGSKESNDGAKQTKNDAYMKNLDKIIKKVDKRVSKTGKVVVERLNSETGTTAAGEALHKQWEEQLMAVSKAKHAEKEVDQETTEEKDKTELNTAATLKLKEIRGIAKAISDAQKDLKVSSNTLNDGKVTDREETCGETEDGQSEKKDECGEEKPDLQTLLEASMMSSPYKCIVCGLVYTDEAELTPHLKTHCGFQAFKCGICEMTFEKSAFLLRAHMKTHMHGYKYACEICKAMFTVPFQLMRHMNRHTDLQKQSVAKSDEEIPNTGDSEKEKTEYLSPYVCNLCDTSVSYGMELISHVKRHYEEQITADESGKLSHDEQSLKEDNNQEKCDEDDHTNSLSVGYDSVVQADTRESSKTEVKPSILAEALQSAPKYNSSLVMDNATGTIYHISNLPSTVTDYQAITVDQDLGAALSEELQKKVTVCVPQSSPSKDVNPKTTIDNPHSFLCKDIESLRNPQALNILTQESNASSLIPKESNVSNVHGQVDTGNGTLKAEPTSVTKDENKSNSENGSKHMITTASSQIMQGKINEKSEPTSDIKDEIQSSASNQPLKGKMTQISAGIKDALASRIHNPQQSLHHTVSPDILTRLAQGLKAAQTAIHTKQSYERDPTEAIPSLQYLSEQGILVDPASNVVVQQLQEAVTQLANTTSATSNETETQAKEEMVTTQIEEIGSERKQAVKDMHEAAYNEVRTLSHHDMKIKNVLKVPKVESDDTAKVSLPVKEVPAHRIHSDQRVSSVLPSTSVLPLHQLNIKGEKTNGKQSFHQITTPPGRTPILLPTSMPISSGSPLILSSQFGDTKSAVTGDKKLMPGIIIGNFPPLGSEQLNKGQILQPVITDCRSVQNNIQAEKMEMLAAPKYANAYDRTKPIQDSFGQIKQPTTSSQHPLIYSLTMGGHESASVVSQLPLSSKVKAEKQISTNAKSVIYPVQTKPLSNILSSASQSNLEAPVPPPTVIISNKVLPRTFTKAGTPDNRAQPLTFIRLPAAGAAAAKSTELKPKQILISEPSYPRTARKDISEPGRSLPTTVASFVSRTMLSSSMTPTVCQGQVLQAIPIMMTQVSNSLLPQAVPSAVAKTNDLNTMIQTKASAGPLLLNTTNSSNVALNALHMPSFGGNVNLNVPIADIPLSLAQTVSSAANNLPVLTTSTPTPVVSSLNTTLRSTIVAQNTIPTSQTVGNISTGSPLLLGQTSQTVGNINTGSPLALGQTTSQTVGNINTGSPLALGQANLGQLSSITSTTSSAALPLSSTGQPQYSVPLLIRTSTGGGIATVQVGDKVYPLSLVFSQPLGPTPPTSSSAVTVSAASRSTSLTPSSLTFSSLTSSSLTPSSLASSSTSAFTSTTALDSINVNSETSPFSLPVSFPSLSVQEVVVEDTGEYTPDTGVYTPVSSTTTSLTDIEVNDPVSSHKPSVSLVSECQSKEIKITYKFSAHADGKQAVTKVVSSYSKPTYYGSLTSAGFRSTKLLKEMTSSSKNSTSFGPVASNTASGTTPTSKKLNEFHGITPAHEELWLCSLCSCFFPTLTDLNEHISYHKSIKEHIYKCEYCEALLYDGSQMQQHSLTHSHIVNKDPHKYECPKCDLQFSYGSQLKYHCIWAHKDCTFPCSFCDQIFLQQQDLSAHIFQHPFLCKVCQQRFNSRKEVEHHVTHHEFTSNACLCKSEFPSRELLHKHIVACNPSMKVNHICYACNIPFVSKRKFDIHSQSHFIRSVFFCGVCRLAFSTSDEAQKHMYVHTTHVACRQCSATFEDSKQMAKHVKTHSKADTTLMESNQVEQDTADAVQSDDGQLQLVGIDVMDKCTRQFGEESQTEPDDVTENRSELINSPMVMEEEEENMEGTNKKHDDFVCSICGARFLTSFKLKQHKVLTHLYPRTNRNMSYYQHVIENIKRPKLFSCKVCGKSFDLQSTLLWHLRFHYDRKNRRRFENKTTLVTHSKSRAKSASVEAIVEDQGTLKEKTLENMNDDSDDTGTSNSEDGLQIDEESDRLTVAGQSTSDQSLTLVKERLAEKCNKEQTQKVIKGRASTSGDSGSNKGKRQQRKKIFGCGICKKSYFKLMKLTKHVWEHDQLEGHGRVTTGEGQSGVSKDSELESEEHEIEGMATELKDEKSETTETSLHSDTMDNDGKSDKTAGKYMCSLCKLKYQDSADLYRHAKLHLGLAEITALAKRKQKHAQVVTGNPSKPPVLIELDEGGNLVRRIVVNSDPGQNSSRGSNSEDSGKGDNQNPDPSTIIVCNICNKTVYSESNEEGLSVFNHECSGDPTK